MEIWETRRVRLDQLIKERFNGVKAQAAAFLGWPATDISRYFNSGKDGRNISERKAREIERKCKLPTYWMDASETKPLQAQQSLAVYSIPDAEREALLDAYSYLTPEQQDDVLNQMRAYKTANEAAIKHLTGRFRTTTAKRAAEKLPPAPRHEIHHK